MSEQNKQQQPPQQGNGLTDIVMTKYKVSADIVKKATDSLISKAVEGVKVIELCQSTDALIEEEASKVFNTKKPIPAKGVSFPTCVSVNNIISHFSPLPSDPETSSVQLKNGDVVKIQLGAHIDGYASIAGETFVVGASEQNPVTGRKADVIQAAYSAAEAAMRNFKVGERNWTVTDTIHKAVKPFETAPVEGMLSCQMTQNVIDGNHTFEEGEVYGVDVLVSTNKANKPKESSYQTTVYKRTDHTYILKLATARKVYSEIQKKAGAFPFTLRTLEDEKRARLGVQESVQHSLLTPFDVSVDKSDEIVSQFFFTIAITKNGPVKITHSPNWFNVNKVKSEKEADEETKQLLSKPLRPKKNNKKNKN